MFCTVDNCSLKHILQMPLSETMMFFDEFHFLDARQGFHVRFFDGGGGTVFKFFDEDNFARPAPTRVARAQLRSVVFLNAS